MKLRYKLYLFVAFFSLFPLSAKAATTCDMDLLKDSQTLANAVQIVYEFDDNKKTYNIIINGISDDFYIFDNSVNKTIAYNGNGSIALSNYAANGQTVKFDFYEGLYNGCRDTYLLTKYIYLPAYNSYSENALCKGYENYELCKKFTPIKIASEAEFEFRLNQYIQDLKNQNNNNSDNKPTHTKVSIWDKMLSFFLKYNLYFLVPIIVLGIAGIVILEKKKKKSVL